MLASEAVNRLNDISRNQKFKGPIGVAFAYLDAEPSDIDPALRLMKQLLRQLVEKCPWSGVLQDTEAWIESTPLSLEAVTVLARKVGKLYDQVYVVIDALDELYSARKGANEAIASLQDLQVNFGAKLLFTLRNVPGVIGQLREDGRIDIQAKEEDVSTIVDRELQHIDIRWSGEKLHSETLRHDLKTIMVSSSKNMFSLAEQAIDRLSTDSLEAVEAFVRSPSESSAFGSFYDREARRLKEQREDYAKLASQVLSLMSFAKRSLTLPEMQQALAFDISNKSKGLNSLDTHDEGVANALVSSCRGLLRVTSRSQEVTWVHDSASVLVGPNASRYFPSEIVFGFHGELRTPGFLVNKLQKMCIACLAHSEFKSGPCRSDRSLEERLTRHPFYRYACKYWAQHVLPLKDKNKDLLWRFLENDQSVAAAYQVYLITQEMPRGTGSSQVAPQGITGMHLVAHFGLHEILGELIERRVDDVTAKDSNGHTPLWWAAKSRMKETAKILIPRDYETVSSLVRFGDVDLVQLLLDAKYDLNRRGAWGRTLLHNAIMEDKPIIAHKLLEEDAEFDQADGNGDTPLALALQKGQRQTADTLLRMGASTKNTTVEQWRNAYGKSQCSVMHITRAVRKSSVKFLESETQDEMEDAVQHQAMNLFISPATSCPVWMRSDQLSLPLQHESFWKGLEITYLVVLRFPKATMMDQKPGFCLPSTVPIGIKWSMIKDENGKDGFRRLTHHHNLPDTWIPEETLHMYLQFLKQMRRRWEMVCENGALHLQHCVSYHVQVFPNLNEADKILHFKRKEILNAKGEDLELTDRLLEDAQQWTELRRELAQQVNAATQFVSEYNRLYREQKAHGDCQDFLHKFQFDVEQSLNSLDTTSQNLINIEFNLVTIREARKSVIMSASLKRLSWITFVFLPATFSASLFGMNVDILRDNPSWKWMAAVQIHYGQTHVAALNDFYLQLYSSKPG
ncbi:unnamed protein product [Alternaria alternata]